MKEKDTYDGRSYSQQDIDKVWGQVWERDQVDTEAALFGGHLFSAGYKTYKPYIEEGGISVLELGAGSGRYGLAIARDFPEAKVIVTDPMTTSIAAIHKIFPKLNLSNVTIELADATKLPYQDNSFDIVFADGVIQHIIDVDAALAEILRVLKPGGRAIVSAVNTINPPHALYKLSKRLRRQEYEYGYERTYRPAELRKKFVAQGFAPVKSDGFTVAYGLLRLKRYRKIYARLGGYLHVLTKLVDRFTGRWASRHLGFMIFVIACKPIISNE